MPQYGTWSPYVGRDAVVLAAALVAIAGVLTYLGIRLQRSLAAARPGKVVGGLVIVIWVLSLATFVIALATYGRELVQQAGPLHLPANPITPVTGLSALAAFIIIISLSWRHGWKTALGSAVVGTAAAPMIFELPFDLIVMGRTYGPAPAGQFMLLYFLPLFLVEISTFSLLTLSPLASLSKYTLCSLAAMFFMFAVWALFAFSYPSQPLLFTLTRYQRF